MLALSSLVFSQSLESLTIIKRMLEYMDVTGDWWKDGHEAVKVVFTNLIFKIFLEAFFGLFSQILK